MSKKTFVAVWVIFFAVFLTYVVATPSRGTSTQMALSAAGRTVVMAIESLIVGVLVYRGIERWNWRHAWVSWLSGLVLIFLVSAAGSADGIDQNAFVRWGWSSAVLAGIQAGVCRKTWHAVTVGCVLLLFLMAVDFVMASLGLYGPFNLRT